MKFLALKEALESVLSIPEPAPKPDPDPIQIQFFSPSEKKQHVVGGDIIRTPIDRTAAMVIAKAPWWAQPPQEQFQPIDFKPVKPEPVKPKPKKKQRMSETPTQHKIHHPGQSPGIVITNKDNDVLNAEMAMGAVRSGTKSITEADQLVAKALDARAALDVMADTWKKSWLDFVDESDQRLAWLRQTRMAFDTETRVLMASLRDVRQFLSDPKHDGEIAKLKEFVDLCERLQTLKSSGFLDTVADTLLKLV